MSMSEDLAEFRPRVALDVDVPSSLAKGLAQQKLVANRSAYKEWQYTTTCFILPEPRRKLALIGETLRSLPLVHTTCTELPRGVDILPAKDMDNNKCINTYDFDRSLGLDSYVFFHWGLPSLEYGNNCVFVDADALLLPDTIVTPTDIGIIGAMSGTCFFDEDAAERAAFGKHYFDMMLTGEDWFILTSLKILEFTEQGGQSYHLSGPATFGEVKVLGPVKASLIRSQVNTANLYNHYKWLLEHGFTVEGIDPKDYDVDASQALHFWRDRLETE